MAKRKGLSKTVRFEVFKRDKFTCQYCGAKAPEAVLEVDHVEAVAHGGVDDLLNLVTSCSPCNRGKGARRLDDASAVQTQRAQLEELAARREQLEMLLRWREGLMEAKSGAVDAVISRIEKYADYTVNENGRANVRRWLNRHSVEVLLSAVDASFETYLRFSADQVDGDSWEKAFAKIPGVAGVLERQADKPYLKDLFYIQGIVRRRLRSRRFGCVEDLEAAHQAGASIEHLMQFCKRLRDVDEFYAEIDRWIEAGGGL